MNSVRLDFSWPPLFIFFFDNNAKVAQQPPPVPEEFKTVSNPLSFFTFFHRVTVIRCSSSLLTGCGPTYKLLFNHSGFNINTDNICLIIMTNSEESTKKFFLYERRKGSRGNINSSETRLGKFL